MLLDGMAVTDIIRDQIEYTTDWVTTRADKEDILRKYNEDTNRFLYYPWGVWVPLTQDRGSCARYMRSVMIIATQTPTPRSSGTGGSIWHISRGTTQGRGKSLRLR